MGDMLSSKWANEPWADAVTAYLSQPDAQHASECTCLQASLPGGITHMAKSEMQRAGGKSAQARVSCNTPPLARGDPRAGGSPVVQRLLHESADPLSACAGDWQGPAGTGKPSGVTSIRPTCDPQAGKPLADSSRTPFPPGRGNLQHSKPADDPINRPAVATRIPNALFRSAPQITVPRQVSIPAASQLSKPGLVELSELGKTTKQILALHHFLLLFFLTASLQLGQSLLLLASHAVAVSVPFLHTGKAAGGKVTAPLLSPGKAAAAGAGAAIAPLLPACKAVAGVAHAPLFPTGQAAAAAPGPEAVTAPLLPAGEAVAGAVPAPLLPTRQAAATAVNAAPVLNGITQLQLPLQSQLFFFHLAMQLQLLLFFLLARLSLQLPPLLSFPLARQLTLHLFFPCARASPQAVYDPPAVTHPPAACAQELPANAIAPRSSSKHPSQLPSRLPPATGAPAFCESEKQVHEWDDLYKQKADALMARVLSNRTSNHSGKALTPKELAAG
ncbi:TPA: hypothetical protein ACH3X1_006712 [Trebouxia sp. C0004]